MKHHGDITVFRLQIIDFAIIKQNIALGDFLQTGNHPHGGCLAATGRAQQYQKFLILYVEVKRINSNKIAPTFGQISKRNTRHIRPYPFTAPAVRPLTICRWKNITSTNSGAVADTTAATAYITFPCSCDDPRKPAIFGTIV